MQGKKPRFFGPDPDWRHLYAANEDSHTIVEFDVNHDTGKLTPTGSGHRNRKPVVHRVQNPVTTASSQRGCASRRFADEHFAPRPSRAYPTKPIRVLVGFSPGGGTDVAIRIIGKKLSELWNQQIIVDNRPGAGGLVAFEIVAKANPDGYTLLATSPSFAIQPGLAAKLPYDPIRDFAPITIASASPYLLVVNPGVEAKTVKDLVALAKASPGKLNYASGGIGSAQHLVTELFRLMAGIDIVHVPYKGAVERARRDRGPRRSS